MIDVITQSQEAGLDSLKRLCNDVEAWGLHQSLFGVSTIDLFVKGQGAAFQNLVSTGGAIRVSLVNVMICTHVSWGSGAMAGVLKPNPGQSIEDLITKCSNVFEVEDVRGDFSDQYAARFSTNISEIIASMTRNVSLRCFQAAMTTALCRRALAGKAADGTTLTAVHADFQSARDLCKSACQALSMDWRVMAAHGGRASQRNLKANKAAASNKKVQELLVQRESALLQNLNGEVELMEQEFAAGGYTFSYDYWSNCFTVKEDIVGADPLVQQPSDEGQPDQPAGADEEVLSELSEEESQTPAGPQRKRKVAATVDSSGSGSDEVAQSEEETAMSRVLARRRDLDSKPGPSILVDEAELGRGGCKCYKRPTRGDQSRQAMLVMEKVDKKDANLFWNSIQAKWSDLSNACWTCLRALGGRAGLQTKQSDRKDLLETFEVVLAAHNIDPVNGIYKLKTGPYHLLFRRGEKPDNEDLKAGVKRFLVAPDEEPPVVDRSAMLDFLAGGGIGAGAGAALLSEYDDKGNLLLKPKEFPPGVGGALACLSHPSMSWLLRPLEDYMITGEERSLQELCEEEAECYRFHQKPDNNHSNYGWNRLQYYSVGQVLARADPVHYMASVALRDDFQTSPFLISWPYYTRWAHADEPSQFCHLDINPTLATSPTRDFLYTVQSSISMSDETEDCCVVLVEGFHKVFSEWWSGIVNKEAAKDEYGCCRIDRKTYGPAEQAKFGKWTLVPCKKGTIRFSKPELLHGSSGSQGKQSNMPGVPATKQVIPRLNYLPWMARVDIHSGEIEYGHCRTTYDEVRLAAINYQVPKRTLGNVSGAKYTSARDLVVDLATVPPTAFGKAITLHGRWRDPEALQTLYALLGSNTSKAREVVMEERLELLKWAHKRFQKLREVEKRRYGSDSFFDAKDSGRELVFAEKQTTKDLVAGAAKTLAQGPDDQASGAVA